MDTLHIIPQPAHLHMGNGRLSLEQATAIAVSAGRRRHALDIRYYRDRAIW